MQTLNNAGTFTAQGILTGSSPVALPMGSKGAFINVPGTGATFCTGTIGASQIFPLAYGDKTFRSGPVFINPNGLTIPYAKLD